MKKVLSLAAAAAMLLLSCDKENTDPQDPDNAGGPVAVDLGLSVKWANANLGASSPEDYGGYYQWAGTRDVSDTSINLY